jgi:hypothetical protein
VAGQQEEEQDGLALNMEREVHLPTHTTFRSRAYNRGADPCAV